MRKLAGKDNLHQDSNYKTLASKSGGYTFIALHNLMNTGTVGTRFPRSK